jgi:hypothetical protein
MQSPGRTADPDHGRQRQLHLRHAALQEPSGRLLPGDAGCAQLQALDLKALQHQRGDPTHMLRRRHWRSMRDAVETFDKSGENHLQGRTYQGGIRRGRQYHDLHYHQHQLIGPNQVLNLQTRLAVGCFGSSLLQMEELGSMPVRFTHSIGRNSYSKSGKTHSCEAPPSSLDQFLTIARLVCILMC